MEEAELERLDLPDPFDIPDEGRAGGRGGNAVVTFFPALSLSLGDLPLLLLLAAALLRCSRSGRSIFERKIETFLLRDVDELRMASDVLPQLPGSCGLPAASSSTTYCRSGCLIEDRDNFFFVKSATSIAFARAASPVARMMMKRMAESCVRML